MNCTSDKADYFQTLKWLNMLTVYLGGIMIKSLCHVIFYQHLNQINIL